VHAIVTASCAVSNRESRYPRTETERVIHRDCNTSVTMRWLWLVGSIKLYVSFAKETYKRHDILQKRPMILSILLTVAIPYEDLDCYSVWSIAICIHPTATHYAWEYILYDGALNLVYYASPVRSFARSTVTGTVSRHTLVISSLRLFIKKLTTQKL